MASFRWLRVSRTSVVVGRGGRTSIRGSKNDLPWRPPLIRLIMCSLPSRRSTTRMKPKTKRKVETKAEA